MPTGNLPSSAKKVWESVYKEAKASGDSQEVAAKKAWSAVKSAGWRKIDGQWAKKSDVMVEMPMYITRASIDDKKVMRWSAVNSDTDPDSYEERMSLELYKDFLGRINNKEPVPSIFKSAAITSDFWKGGMPYLSISHYPDLNGEAVPGQPTEIYVDGIRLKAKGILYNAPLGIAVYRSLQEDKYKNPEDRIRISIGFLDLAHKHGDGDPWERKSLTSLCHECLAGIGNKVYVSGYLVHLALTRFPVNKRTEMVLEEN